ncbi:MAG: hypothetical protein QW808_02700 [Desulfurococcaceae archaeon]
MLILNSFMIFILVTVGILLGGHIFIESGFKLFIVHIFIVILAEKLKSVYLNSLLVLVSLLSFYSIEFFEKIALPFYALSCLLVSLLTDVSRVGKIATFIWFYILTAVVLPLELDTTAKFTTFVGILLLIILAKSTTRIKLRLPRESMNRKIFPLQRKVLAQTLVRINRNKTVSRCAQGRQDFYEGQTQTLSEMVKYIREKTNKTSLFFNVALRNITNFLKEKPTIAYLDADVEKLLTKAGNSLVNHVSRFEFYVNIFSGKTLIYIIGLSSKLLTIEDKFSNRLQRASVRVEGLQHNVDQALVYLLFLLSVILMITLIFYVIYTAQIIGNHC